MTTSPQSMSDLPEHNPWREFIENCANGDNFFRRSEYNDLIEELDRLYLIEESCRATAEQAGKVELEKRVLGRLDPGAHSIGAGPFRIGIDGGDDGWCVVITRGRTIVAMVDDAKPTQPAATQPVAWQYRVDVHRDGNWSDWRPCTENFHDEIIEFGECVEGDDPRGVIADARTLYASPVSPSREVEALERAAKLCESMVVVGRSWSESQQWAADALLAAAKNIRALAPVQEKALEVSEIRKVAKRNLRSLIQRSSDSEKELMLKCLEELS
jgi:hypothetical protein